MPRNGKSLFKQERFCAVEVVVLAMASKLSFMFEFVLAARFVGRRLWRS